MKWFEYKRELDTLHAPDALKARLLAMPCDASAADGPRLAAADTFAAADAAFSTVPKGNAFAPQAAPAKKRRSPLRWKPIAALAACCVLGIAGVGAALDSGFWRMGSAAPMGMVSANTAGEMTSGAAAAGPEMSYDTEAGMVQDAAQLADTLPQSRTGTSRKIIYSSRLTLETMDYDNARAALEQNAANADGYVESVEEYSYTDANRSSDYTFRIPAAQYESFLAGAAAAASVIERSENAEDITGSYMDVAAHITALTTQRDSLLAMEAKAESLTDLLAIQDQLTNVQYELDSWQSKMNYMDDQVDYCTVSVTLQEVSTYTPVKTSLGQRIANAFVVGLTGFGTALTALLLGLIRLWPWLVLALAVGGVILLCKKRRNRK